MRSIRATDRRTEGTDPGSTDTGSRRGSLPPIPSEETYQGNHCQGKRPEPLANIIMLQMTNKSIEEEAEAFVSEEKEVASVADAIAGAKDIIAEHISDEADYRIHIRDLTAKKGTISSVAKDPETQSVYEMYYEFEEPVKKLAGHRVLALNRGEKEKFLTIKIAAPEEDILRYLEKQVITRETRLPHQS